MTKPIKLENPASGIKVILDAYLNDDSDLRLFYSTGGSNLFIPFPGYVNYQSGGAIDTSLSDGTSDVNIKKSDSYSFQPGSTEFVEHEYTIDDISSFTEFRIKLIGSTSNSSYVPQVRNFRAIALGAGMNKNYIKVKDHKNLYRDSSTNSIINADSSEYENYLREEMQISKRLLKLTN